MMLMMNVLEKMNPIWLSNIYPLFWKLRKKSTTKTGKIKWIGHFLPNSRSQHCPQKKVSLWTIGSATVNIGVNCGVDCWWWCLLSIAQQKEGLHELRRLAWCEQTLKVGPLCLSYDMSIQSKKQCLGLLSLWQCFPLLGILWRKILLLLQTKSPAVWTIGRAFVFRSGSRYDKVFSNISHS